MKLARHALPAALALAALAACSPAPEPEREAPGQQPAAAQPGHAAGEADVLVIEPGLRRDLRLTTATVERRHDAPGSLALGELRADEGLSAEISAPVEARVLRLLAAPGDAVHAGQPLVELHSVELGRARAEAAAAQARLALAQAAEARTAGLAGEGVAPARELEAAQAERASAEAARDAAQAALAAFGLAEPAAPAATGGAFTLTAPLDGTLLARDAVVGRVVHPGDVLFRQADLRTLWLVVHAYERDALRVHVGATADVTLPALPGGPLTGRVSWVGAEVEAGTRTVPVRVEIANADGRLRPGLSGSARLPLEGTGDVLAVPTAALQRGPEGWCVFLPAGEDRFTCRTVGRGRDLGGSVEVLSGLQQGETVVVDGAFLLRAELLRRSGGDQHEP